MGRRSTSGRLGGWAVAASALGAVAWSARRNLGPETTTWDEDEVVYFDLAAEAASHIYTLSPTLLSEGLTQTIRPPLTIVTDAALLLLMQPDPAVLSFLRVAWIGLLLWGVAAFVHELTDRSPRLAEVRGAALPIGVGLVATAPAVLQLGSSLMSEVPLAALGIHALRYLARPPTAANAAKAGVVCGLGMLVKWTFPVILVGPAVVYAVTRARPVRWWITVAGVGALLCGPWYLASLDSTVPFILEASVGEGARAYGADQRTALEETGYYLLTILGDLFWLPLAVFVLVGVGRAAREDGRELLPLLAAAIAPPLLFSLLANKEIRYLLPIVPVLGVLAGLGLALLRARWSRLPVVLVVLGAVVVASGLPLQGQRPAKETKGGGGPIEARFDGGAGMAGLPTRVALRTPLGSLTLWSRGTRSFKYRMGLRDGLPIREIDQRVQQLNPGGPRAAAVLSPEPWLWTPLWAEGARHHGWTRWRSAQCDPVLVSEASFFVTLEPVEPPTAHCRAATIAGRERFAALRPSLQSLGRWAVDGRTLTLWVARNRLYPNQPVPASRD